MGAASVDACTIIAWYEMYYVAGFTGVWWMLMIAPVSLIIAVSGWVVYRFRQTGAMTMAQFFEMRYSKNFRIFAGLLAFASGIVNFGIFPAVDGRFFMVFAGLPEHIMIGGLNFPVLPIVAIIIVGIAFLFTIMGGQITVMVTDFIQGTFLSVVMTVIVIYLLFGPFQWKIITDALATAPAQESMLNPFSTSKTAAFNVWFFIIMFVLSFYRVMAWQGSQGYFSSAKSPHEARMAKILGQWRIQGQTLAFLLVPICAYVVMHHSAFSDTASIVTQELNQIENQSIQKQMLVPTAARTFLPRIMSGLVFAMMFAAYLATYQSYLHSWGSIFVQDIILPLRGSIELPKKHLQTLRLSIFGVAVFVFLFSVFFEIKEYIFMYMAVTGSIYIGGAGSAIIGGLYWRRGTTVAAWCSLIIGAILSITGIVVKQAYPKFPIDGQWIAFIASGVCILIYIIVSLLSKEKPFDLDKLLHRDSTANVGKKKKIRLSEKLGINHEFTLFDKIVYYSSIGWICLSVLVFVIGVVVHLTVGMKDTAWMAFWHGYVWVLLVLSVIVTVWFMIFGFKDMLAMFRHLRSAARDFADDGTVIKVGNAPARTPETKIANKI